MTINLPASPLGRVAKRGFHFFQRACSPFQERANAGIRDFISTAKTVFLQHAVAPTFPIRGVPERYSRLVDFDAPGDSNFRRKRLIPGLSHRGVFRDRSAFLSPSACSFGVNLCRAITCRDLLADI